MLNKQLDVELISSLDRDGDGIDKAEFVLGMLEVLGLGLGLGLRLSLGLSYARRVRLGA